MGEHLLVLFLSLLAEAFYGAYILSVNRHRLLPAVICTLALNFIGGAITLNYVRDPTLLATAAIGEAMGTAIIVTYFARQSKKEEATSRAEVVHLQEQAEELEARVEELSEILCTAFEVNDVDELLLDVPTEEELEELAGPVVPLVA